MDDCALLKAMFEAAVRAADPAHTLGKHLPDPPRGRTIVVGGGKAGGSMARALADAWDGPLEGLVVTRYEHGADAGPIRVVEASHPVPDDAGQAAAREMLELVSRLTEDDLVIALVSGGASALLSVPADGITLSEKQAINRALLKSGAAIDQMNAVRKHLSGIKGGRLAARCYPARVVTLAISDVPGDDPDVIGSGPTVPDRSTRQDALEILERYEIDVPASVSAHLEQSASESPKPGDNVFARTEFRMIATPQMSLEAAAAIAKEHGITPVMLGDAIEGEARDVARDQAQMALQLKRSGDPVSPPAVLLSGGETTVTVQGNGRGGRNAEYLLALGVALDGTDGISAFSGDTDGIDGTEDNAGAYLRPDTLARAAAQGL
ncbi:MAG: glycerate kinase, partial [Pseudomonadota bacterium]